MSEEVTYYSDDAIQITNARVVVRGKTYAMANITSVTMGVRPANQAPGVLIAITGLLITIGFCGLFLAALPTYRESGDAFGISFAGGVLLFGLLVLAFGIWVARIPKPSYIVRLGSASGEADALVSKDREYIQKIVNALNEAIIERG